MHFYPKGALQTPADVEDAIGEVIYCIYYNGNFEPYMETLTIDGAPFMEGNIGLFVRVTVESKFSGGTYKSTQSLCDRNIETGRSFQHYNGHYWFARAEDAAAYLEHCRL